MEAAEVTSQRKVYEPVENVMVWVDGGIMLKTCDPHGDPVEMTEVDAEALCKLLLALVRSERGECNTPE